ncbi:hypothetical protein QIV92_24345 [Raoultella ornithinolytica]|nr:hypothetical protein [Raoultella ornithinolytica]
MLQGAEGTVHEPRRSLKSPTMGNLCQALGIGLIAHKARNARATGSVEKARDILERDFEHGLRFCRVESIDELGFTWRVCGG